MMLRLCIPRCSISLVFGLAAVLSCAGPIRLSMAPDVSRLEIEKWQELRSPDFILYSRGSTKDLEDYALDLARYVAVVERLVSSQPPKIPARLFLVEDRARELFIPYRSLRGYVNYSVAGFSSFMIVSSHNAGYRNLLLHEFTHYLNLRNTKLEYPYWYIEGFAEFLGSIRTRDDVMEIGSAPPSNLLRLEYRRLRREKIDLATIFSFKRDGKTRDPSDFYEISWAVVHYLSSDADRRKRMVSMLDHQGAGVHWDRAYARSFSEPIDLLASKISRHAELLSRGTPSAVSYLPLDSLDVRDSWEIRKIPANEILRIFGEAALRGVVYLKGGAKAEIELAEALFRRASELDPEDSESHAGLAAALSAQSKFGEAEFQLVAFRDDPEPSVEAIVHAGDAVLWHAMSFGTEGETSERKSLHTSAIRLYQRALDLEPRNAFALVGLGSSQLETKDLEAARKSFANAESVGEWDAKLRLNQGLVEQQLGFVAEAKSFWNEVVRLGTENEAKQAAALLDEIN